jgi:hypothetical protein
LVLRVAGRQARLTVDTRRDRFAGARGVVEVTLREVALARLDLESGRLLAVDAGAATLPAGHYLLVGMACDAEGCGQRAF